MDRVHRYAPLSGVAFVVLFAVGSTLWALDQPAIGADPSEIVDFYRGTSARILVGGSLSLVSIAPLVWFGSILRDALTEAESDHPTGLPLTAFGGILLVCAVGLGAETINMVGAVRAEDDGGLSPGAAQTYLDVSSAFGYWSAGAALAVVAASTAVVAIRTDRILSRRFAWATLALAAALMTPVLITSTGKFAFSLPLLLLAAISISIYRERLSGSASPSP
jgi:hypothetical protein